MLVCSLFAVACTLEKRPQYLTVVIGSWYGFYPFYYARHLGIDQRHNVTLKVLEPNNITNLRRAYMRSKVDFVATSMVEFINARNLVDTDYSALLITDYSQGGDVIIANKSIQTIDELRGKKIAAPYNGIGQYLLTLVFETTDLRPLFKQVPISDIECLDALESASIDACVTYPPLSTYLLKNPKLHQIYSSSEHPGRVFDLLWSKSTTSEESRKAMQSIWFDTIAEIEKAPDEYTAFISMITRVENQEAANSMAGIKLAGSEVNTALFADKAKLAADLVNVCLISQGKDCKRFSSAFDSVSM